MIRITFKWIFAGIFLVASLGYARALSGMFANLSGIPPSMLWFGGGMLLFLVLWIFLFSRRDSFWGVLEHELTHALFALIFFKKVRSISAHRRKGGMVQVEGGNFLIALAPYFFPLFSVFVLLLKPLVKGNYQNILDGLLGFTLLFHIMDLMREFHPGQPDIQQTGFWFSSALTLFFNIFFVGLVLASVLGNSSQMMLFLKSGFQESWKLLTLIYVFLASKAALK